MQLIDKLAMDAGISSDELYAVLKSKETHYKDIYIKKRNGEKRLLNSPDEVLSRVQRAVVARVFLHFGVSRNTAAYEKGCSVVKTAKKHCGATLVICADIKGFFPSIGYALVESLLKKKYSPQEIDLIWNIVSLNKGLPIGAPSSPAVSNRIMLAIDKRIAKAAKKCTYTRYADDITLSSKKLKKESAEQVLNKIQAILHQYGFKLNDQKTRIKDRTGSQRVLGLIVNGGKTSIGLKKRKKFKQDIYNYLTHKKGSKARLQGKIAYYKQAEPDFIKKLQRKYNPIGYSNCFK